MPQTKISVPRVSDAVARTLEQRILEGSLKPGDCLPPERVLAAELGVSRPSLREAIQKLASKGMLHSRQGGGTYVTDHLDSSLFDPWQDMLRGHPDLREDLIEFRRVLGGQTAEWAAERGTEADIARIARAYEALMALKDTEDHKQVAMHDMAFHQAIAEASHNVFMGHLTVTVLRLMEEDICLNLLELSRVPRAIDMLKSQHTTLFKAICEHRPAVARSAAETHMDFVHETLAQSLRSAARRETAARRLTEGDFSSSKTSSF